MQARIRRHRAQANMVDLAATPCLARCQQAACGPDTHALIHGSNMDSLKCACATKRGTVRFEARRSIKAAGSDDSTMVSAFAATGVDEANQGLRSWLQQAVLLDEPGSVLQQQYFSLLLSFVKYSSITYSKDPAAADKYTGYAAAGAFLIGLRVSDIASLISRLQAFSTTLEQLIDAVTTDSTMPGTASTMQQSHSSGGCSNGSGSVRVVGDGGDGSGSSSSSMASLQASEMPFVSAGTVLGRCFVQYGERLLQSMGEGQQDSAAAVAYMGRVGSNIEKMLAASEQLLPASGTLGFDEHAAARLSAAGCDEKVLQKSWEAVTGALEVYGRRTEALAELPLQLQRYGHDLSALPLLLACNNPQCEDVQSASEQIVVERDTERDGVQKHWKCQGCKTVYCCSTECQLQHWVVHKPVCETLKARRKAASSKTS